MHTSSFLDKCLITFFELNHSDTVSAPKNTFKYCFSTYLMVFVIFLIFGPCLNNLKKSSILPNNGLNLSKKFNSCNLLFLQVLNEKISKFFLILKFFKLKNKF